MSSDVLMDIGIAVILGLGVVVGGLLHRNRDALRVTCEVYRDRSLDSVLPLIPTGSMSFIHIDETWHPYAIVIISVTGSPPQGTLRSIFHRTNGDHIVREWPIPKTIGLEPVRGLFVVAADVVSVSTSVSSEKPMELKPP